MPNGYQVFLTKMPEEMPSGHETILQKMDQEMVGRC